MNQAASSVGFDLRKIPAVVVSDIFVQLIHPEWIFFWERKRFSITAFWLMGIPDSMSFTEVQAYSTSVCRNKL